MEPVTANMTLDAEHPIRRLQRTALIAGVAGLVLTAIGFFVTPDQFFRSYLLGFLYWFGIALGSIVALHERVEALAHRINERFGREGWRPIILARFHHEPPAIWRKRDGP